MFLQVQNKIYLADTVDWLECKKEILVILVVMAEERLRTKLGRGKSHI